MFHTGAVTMRMNQDDTFLFIRYKKDPTLWYWVSGITSPMVVQTMLFKAIPLVGIRILLST
ncbi:hypothetical protein V12B01_09186 [Vibrio splendidus 12B01]|jgi:hypothetical protein|nr:hypothetical protein V12B01_09186 [Vibrio splendidus 12B01]